MNKIKMNIWGRDFDLPVMIKQFKGKEITDIQKDAVEKFTSCEKVVNEAKDDVEKYVIKNGLAALEVSLCLQNIQINRMMRYYTDDKRVLELATIVEKLYDSDDTLGEKYVKAHITTMRGMLRKLKYIGKSIK